MGKIVKFDPKKRRGGSGKGDGKSWTRPEDYGASNKGSRGPAKTPLDPAARNKMAAWALIAVLVAATAWLSF